MNTRRLVLLLALAAAGCDRSRSEAPPPPSSVGACAALDAEACRKLAWRHSRFGDAPFNPLRSLWLYEDACRLGDMLACASAADAHAQRHEHMISPNTKGHPWCKGEDGVECQMPTDNARAAVLYVRACRAGIAAACTWGGDLYLTDYEGIPKDVRVALHMFELACAANDPHGCYLLGELVAGDEVGAKDLVRAASLQDKSCALGDRDGCWRAGYNYDEGWGVARDPAIAVARYQTICDKKYFDFLCCTRLADHYVAGDGVAKNPARAAAIYQQHCGDGKTGGGSSCRKLAALYERGEGVEKNLVKAGELYLEACKTFAPDACADAERLGAHR